MNPVLSFASLMQGDKDGNNLDAGLTYAFESYNGGSQSASYQSLHLSSQSDDPRMRQVMPDGSDKMQFRGNSGWQVLNV